MIETEKCGCGKEGRYMNMETGLASCHKRGRCMTYDELSSGYTQRGLKITALENEINAIKLSFSAIKDLFTK